jgi:hypothetical protein
MMARGHENGGRPASSPRDRRLLEVLQHDTQHLQDLLSPL